jgi:hypothetical protein
MPDREITLQCQVCGGLEFERVNFPMEFQLNDAVTRLNGERCAACGQVLLFLNEPPQPNFPRQNFEARPRQADNLN